MEQQKADELRTPPAAADSEELASNIEADPQTSNDETSLEVKVPASVEKKSLKEKVKEEAKEVLSIIIYLSIWLTVLATLRCLILLQYGINEFKNAYVMAIVSAVALAKVIAIAQKLPIVNRMRHRPVFWACVYKACFFTLVVSLAHRVEERFIHTSVDPNLVFPLAGVISHLAALFGIFFVLFLYRDVDSELGKGSLKKLLFKSRKTENS
jgi:hypothetical protein